MGGRVTVDIEDALLVLDRIARRAGGRLGPGWNVIVLHHTDCGITRVTEPPQLLEKYLGRQPGQLHSHGGGVTDPQQSVRADVAALKANAALPGGYVLSGCVYDVATGRVEIVVQAEQLPERQPSSV